MLLPVEPVVAAAQEASAPTGPTTESRLARPGGRGARMGRPPLPANPEVMTPVEIERYMDQVVLYQAQSQLKLTDDQLLRFGPSLGRLRMARRQQQRRRLMMLRDLNQLLAASPMDEGAVTAKLKELDDFASESNRQVQDAYAAIDRLLDLRQRARFRVFEEEMERRTLNLLARARQGGPPGAGRGQ